MMSAKAGKRPLRSLTAHEKLEAIRRVHDGESKASVARDIGVPESTLRGWCKNEEKISYISRQSSPETDDSLLMAYEPKEKKMKLSADLVDAPFNLSMKSNSGGDLIGLDKPLNLNLKSNDASPKMSERERNRAELARLSIELGLNRPEMYSSGSTLAELTANITNLGLLSQWNSILMQQSAAAAAVGSGSSGSGSKKKVTAAPADTSSNVITSSNNLLTTATAVAAAAYGSSKDALKLNGSSLDLPKLDSQKSVEDSVWYWLKQQQMLGLTQATNLPSSTSSSSTPVTTGSALPTSTAAGLAGAIDQNSSWFWKWYKQYTLAAQQLHQQHQQQQQQQQKQRQDQQSTTLNATTTSTATTTTGSSSSGVQQQPQQAQAPPQPQQILYQQLTKEAKSAESPIAAEPSASADNAENQNAGATTASTTTTAAADKPQSNTHKARAVLDNLLLNNNNVQHTNCNGSSGGGGGGKDDGGLLTQTEAIEHGEKFLKWLECCSEPSVTAMQIMQFRGLINNLKTGADRKNGDVQQKTKVRRK